MARPAVAVFLFIACFPAVSCGPRPGEIPEETLAGPVVAADLPPGLYGAPATGPLLAPGRWRPEVHAALERLIRSQGRPDLPLSERPVVTLDFDNTCVRNDIGLALLRELVERRALRIEDDAFWGTIPEELGRAELRRRALRLSSLGAATPLARLEEDPDFRRWRKGLLSFYEELRDREGNAVGVAWLARVMVGMSPDEIRRYTQLTLERHLRLPLGHTALVTDPDDPEPFVVEDGIRIHSEMRELVAALQRYGFDVWIVSASNQWSVEVAAQRLGIAGHHVIAVRAAQGADGRLRDLAEEPVTYRAGKVEAIQRYVGRAPVLAIGDAMTDREMLAAATELAVLIDRGDEKLREIARDKGWQIQPQFVEDGEPAPRLPPRRSTDEERTDEP